MKLSPKKRAFLAGALLLACTGFLCRILGFFYRIYLSRTIGAEGLGLYNMVHPVFGICFALCAGSIQTAVSQCVAANMKKGRTIFLSGAAAALSISVFLAVLIWRSADLLAARILMEERCAPLLPYIALSIPCSAVHACINGYYYGMQKTKVPAFSQVAEQLVRMGIVFLIADIMTGRGMTLTVQLAVIGHLAGEAASCLFTLLAVCLFQPGRSVPEPGSDPARPDDPAVFGADPRSESPQDHPWQDAFLPLMAAAFPLRGTRLGLYLLASTEAIWIPERLRAFGFSPSDALSVYGVLTGMALPFILFPSAITNSIAVLLLPAVARAQSEGNRRQISSTISASIRYSLYMGILCIGVFTLYGSDLGSTVFHNGNAGDFIVILAWLCPFLYLSTTMGSILNGLGKNTTTFLQNTAAMLLRLGFVFFGIPRYGMAALLWGMLASELFLALLHLYSLEKLAPFSWNAWNMIVKPAFFLAVSIGITRFFTAWEITGAIFSRLHGFLSICLQSLILSACYGGLLLSFHRNRTGRCIPAKKT